MEWNACRDIRDKWKWIIVILVMKNVVIDNQAIDKQAIIVLKNKDVKVIYMIIQLNKIQEFFFFLFKMLSCM